MPIINITIQYYLKHAKPMCVIVSLKNTDENPHLVNALDSSSSHPLIRKYSYKNYIEILGRCSFKLSVNHGRICPTLL